MEGLKSYAGEVILVGINYEKEMKQHTCIIEKIQKEKQVESHRSISVAFSF